MVLIELKYWKMVCGDLMLGLFDKNTRKSDKVSELAGRAAT